MVPTVYIDVELNTAPIPQQITAITNQFAHLGFRDEHFLGAFWHGQPLLLAVQHFHGFIETLV